VHNIALIEWAAEHLENTRPSDEAAADAEGRPITYSRVYWALAAEGVSDLPAYDAPLTDESGPLLARLAREHLEHARQGA
jgi:hypothetical protein